MANSNDKWRYTLYTTLVFLLLVNPIAYKFINNSVGNTEEGCPTLVGFIIVALVFTIILRLMMEIKL